MSNLVTISNKGYKTLDNFLSDIAYGTPEGWEESLVLNELISNGDCTIEQLVNKLSTGNTNNGSILSSRQTRDAIRRLFEKGDLVFLEELR